jgi:hypothetical protein
MAASFSGSERESVESCILRGFLKGSYFPSVGRPNSTFSTEWPINGGLAVEMTLRGRDDGASATTVLPALGAWKPAKDAGFHIPTATATRLSNWDKLLNPRQSYISTDSRAEPVFDARFSTRKSWRLRALKHG